MHGTTYLSSMLRFFATLFFMCVLFPARDLRAQEADFCEAVTAIYRDARFAFRNVHGDVRETSVGLAIFKTNIIVPGTINSRFVFAMGKFYEGALAQSKSLGDIKGKYEQYKAKLNDCLIPQGLHMTLMENFDPGLYEYKKVAFMPTYSPTDDVKSLKGHVTLEVDYNKISKIYTLILFVYEH